QCAKRLGKGVSEKRRISVSEEKIKKWANQIRLLIQEDLQLRTTAFEDVENAITAFEKSGNNRYFPVIKNASDFRKRFIDIEEFMKRNSSISIAEKGN